jgi:hypothetical protein
MSRYQVFKDAIETFQPGGAKSSILFSTTEVNEKGFQALLGRKIKWRSMSISIAIITLAIIAASAITIIFFGHTGTPSFAAFVPLFIIIFLFRTTLITVNDDGLDFYFIDSKFGRKYVAYDKISLSYDMITNVKIRTGKFNTGFTFEFSNGDKKYKIKTTVPNKMRKVSEQAENMKHILEMLEKRTDKI